MVRVPARGKKSRERSPSLCPDAQEGSNGSKAGAFKELINAFAIARWSSRRLAVLAHYSLSIFICPSLPIAGGGQMDIDCSQAMPRLGKSGALSGEKSSSSTPSPCAVAGLATSIV